MPRKEIDTIVFDLGGVLIDWNPRYLYRKIFDTEEEVEHFLENVCRYEWNVKQDAGRTIKDATDFLVNEHPEWEPQIRAYYDRWEEMLGGQINGTVAILESLRIANLFRLYALTNWSAETFSVPVERYDFFRHFEGVVVSGQEKLAKPDPRLYQILFDRYKIIPERAVFIDDSIKNVEAARKLGMHAIQFFSPMQLQEELAQVL